MHEVEMNRNEQPQMPAGQKGGKYAAKKKRKLRTLPLIVTGVLIVGLVFGASKLVKGFTAYSVSATILDGAVVEEQTEEATEVQTEAPAAQEKVQTEEVPSIPQNSYRTDYFIKNQNGFMTYDSPLVKGVVAIDVSSHQGEIDWNQVAASGVEAAIIRVGYRGYTEGSIQADTSFQQNLQNAVDAGLKVSLYFFSQAISVEEAREEASFVLTAVSQLPAPDTIYFDWEDVGEEARTDEMTPELLTNIASTFCSCIKAGGFEAGIYFNQNLAAGKLLLSDLSDYRFWLAEYGDTPTFEYRFDCWQYSDSGTVPGISEKVDLNVLFETK